MTSRKNRRRMKRKLKQKQAVAKPYKKASKKPSKISFGQPDRKSDNRLGFVPTERDLESDEAVWDLYNRWCLHYKVHRTPEEMQMRFDSFKKDAVEVLQANQKSIGAQQLFMYSDLTDEEWEHINFGVIPDPEPSRRGKASRKK